MSYNVNLSDYLFFYPLHVSELHFHMENLLSSLFLLVKTGKIPTGFIQRFRLLMVTQSINQAVS